MYNPHLVYRASKNTKEYNDGADNKAPAIPQNTITHTKQKMHNPGMRWGSPSQLGRMSTAITDQYPPLWNHPHPLKMQHPRQK